MAIQPSINGLAAHLKAILRDRQPIATDAVRFSFSPSISLSLKPFAPSVPPAILLLHSEKDLAAHARSLQSSRVFDKYRFTRHTLYPFSWTAGTRSRRVRSGQSHDRPPIVHQKFPASFSPSTLPTKREKMRVRHIFIHPASRRRLAFSFLSCQRANRKRENWRKRGSWAHASGRVLHHAPDSTLAACTVPPSPFSCSPLCPVLPQPSPPPPLSSRVCTGHPSPKHIIRQWRRRRRRSNLHILTAHVGGEETQRALLMWDRIALPIYLCGGATSWRMRILIGPLRFCGSKIH